MLGLSTQYENMKKSINTRILDFRRRLKFPVINENQYITVSRTGFFCDSATLAQIWPVAYTAGELFNFSEIYFSYCVTSVKSGLRHENQKSESQTEVPIYLYIHLGWYENLYVNYNVYGVETRKLSCVCHCRSIVSFTFIIFTNSHKYNTNRNEM